MYPVVTSFLSYGIFVMRLSINILADPLHERLYNTRLDNWMNI